MPVHQPIARNYAVASENKIHSDDVAKRLGFTGALVPGVTVFGHLTWPLTAELGSTWLAGSWVTTRFLKPAYDGERLTITDDRHANSYKVECRNPQGALIATLECTPETQQPDVDMHALRTSTQPAERVHIAWDTIQIDQPFPTYVWKPDAALNAEYARRLDDDTLLFQQGLLHPHAILSQANQALVRRFIMPAWIHTGSEIRFRQLLHVDDAIEVRSTPMEKWEKKGHQFIKLYIAYLLDGEVATEIYHSAIFKVAGA